MQEIEPEPDSNDSNAMPFLFWNRIFQLHPGLQFAKI